MKVTQVHNFYKQSGGEANVLKKEKELLQTHGQNVLQFLKDNKTINGGWDYLKIALNTRYSRKTYNEFCDFVNDKQPDIVHVHNFFPLISPSIFDCTVEKQVPSILTLHNYRLLHPNGLMLHDGEIDERSLKGSAYQCVWDGVYRDSILQTAVVANMIEYHRKKKTWHNKVDGFIALTEFAKNKFIEGGFPAEKIYVKPNFVEDSFEGNRIKKKSEDREGYLFLGRVSKEKGIEDLINAWMKNRALPDLFIIGDGPLKNNLETETSGFQNINWLGRIPNEEVFDWLNKVKAMIFPSTWYEGFPMTILEAFSMGCPVITTNIGSQQSIIDDGVTGLHFQVGDKDDLLSKVELLERNNSMVREFGQNAREEYLKSYTPEKNYKRLLEIYSKVSSN